MVELLRYDLSRWKECECCGEYSNHGNICDDCSKEINELERVS